MKYRVRIKEKKGNIYARGFKDINCPCFCILFKEYIENLDKNPVAMKVRKTALDNRFACFEFDDNGLPIPIIDWEWANNEVIKMEMERKRGVES